MISLKEAQKFHGHLGPYLVLGLLAGELALKKLGAGKYFGLEVKVYGAVQKPKSCLIDGLQLSTGATFGKGNIKKFNAAAIKMEFINRINQKKFTLKFKSGLIQKLEAVKIHKDSEILAKELYRANYIKLFHVAAGS